MSKKSLKSEKGFTIIEIISVLLIVGIMAAVVYPSFNTSGVDVRTAANMIKTDVRFIQQLAFARNAAASISFSSGASTYTFTDPLGIFSFTRDMGNATFDGNDTVSFNSLGEREAANGNINIFLTAGGEQLRVRVRKITGWVRIE